MSANLSVINYGDLLTGIAPLFAYDMEGALPPAGAVDNGNWVQSTEWSKSGTKSVKMSHPLNGGGGAYWRPVGGVAKGWQVSLWARIVSLAEDGKCTRLIWAGDWDITYASPMVQRSATKLYWGLSYYKNGVGDYVSTVECFPNTDYYLQMIVGEEGNVHLHVNGILVASLSYGAATKFDVLGWGGFTDLNHGTAVFYIDDIKFYPTTLRGCMPARVDANTIVASANSGASHSGFQTERFFKSTDGGRNFTLKDTGQIAGKSTGSYGTIKFGADIYSFLAYFDNGAPYDYRGKIYKSTDSGETRVECYDSPTAILIPTRIFNGTKILCARWEVSTWPTGSLVDSAWFDTANNTLQVGGRLGTYNQSGWPLWAPNECCFYRMQSNPSRLVALLRWENSLNIKISSSYSDDEGATWSTPVEITAWANRGGMVRAAFAKNELYVQAYHKIQLNISMPNKHWRADEITLATIGTDEYPIGQQILYMTEVGNGDIMAGQALNRLDSGITNNTAMFYELLAADIPSTFPAYSLIHRMQRQRRAA